MIYLTRINIVIQCYGFRFKIRFRKEGKVYLMMHSTHFIYDYMVSDLWWKTTQIAETYCHHYITWPSLHQPLLVQEIAQCVHHEGLIRWPIAPWPWADALPWSTSCSLIRFRARVNDRERFLPVPIHCMEPTIILNPITTIKLNISIMIIISLTNTNSPMA